MKPIKNNDYLKLYEIYKRFPYFPDDSDEQREIVRKFYSVVYRQGGIVDAKEAGDGRIYFVAKSNWEKAHRIINKLSEPEKIVLECLSEIKRLKEKNKDDPKIFDLEERICIILEGNNIDNVEPGINNAAYKILGHSLDIEDPTFDPQKL